jgi:transposase
MHLIDARQQALERLLQANAHLSSGYARKEPFHQLTCERDRPAFDQWLQEAETAGLPLLQTATHDFRRDEAAIQATLNAAWSAEPREGESFRTNFLKRMGYGCANLDLLQQHISRRNIRSAEQVESIVTCEHRVIA